MVAASGLITTTDFTYQGLALQSLSASQSGTGSASWKITYIYDEYGRPYGGVYRSPATSTSPVFFGMVTTDRGDVVELLDPAGNPFAAYRYDAWGNPQGTGNVTTGIWSQSTALVTSQVASAIASRQPLRYASYCFDSESGMYYLSSRHYDPATRQFLSKDLSRNDGEQSAYQYCLGNPVGNVDPTGYRPDEAEAVKLWLANQKAAAKLQAWLNGWKNYYGSMAQKPKSLGARVAGAVGGAAKKAGGWVLDRLVPEWAQHIPEGVQELFCFVTGLGSRNPVYDQDDGETQEMMRVHGPGMEEAFRENNYQDVTDHGVGHYDAFSRTVILPTATGRLPLDTPAAVGAFDGARIENVGGGMVRFTIKNTMGVESLLNIWNIPSSWFGGPQIGNRSSESGWCSSINQTFQWEVPLSELQR